MVIFVAMLVVQKGSDLSDKFKNKKPVNTMTVSAEGKVPAVPDMAEVTIGVLTQGATAQDVKDKNNEKINKVIAFIKEQGIDSKDIKTSQFNFYPQQDWNNGTPRITGYQSNQTVTVKVKGVDKDQSKLEKIMDGAVNVGANEIPNVVLSFEDPDNLRQEARKQAIAKAKAKAQELAAEAGLTLGKVVSVSESGGGGYYPPMPYAAAGVARDMVMNEAKSVPPNIEPGSQEITQTMTVVFEVK